MATPKLNTWLHLEDDSMESRRLYFYAVDSFVLQELHQDRPCDSVSLLPEGVAKLRAFLGLGTEEREPPTVAEFRVAEFEQAMALLDRFEVPREGLFGRRLTLAGRIEILEQRQIGQTSTGADNDYLGNIIKGMASVITVIKQLEREGEPLVTREVTPEELARIGDIPETLTVSEYLAGEYARRTGKLVDLSRQQRIEQWLADIKIPPSGYYSQYGVKLRNYCANAFLAALAME